MATFTDLDSDAIKASTTFSRSGSQYTITDQTDPAIWGGTCDFEDGMMIVPWMQTVDAASTMEFTDATIRFSNLLTSLRPVFQRGSVTFTRCNIWCDNGVAGSEAVFGGFGSFAAGETANVTFRDCYISGAAAVVLNARRWIVQFVNTSISSNVVLQLPFGTPQTGVTLTGSRTNSGQTYGARIVAALPGTNGTYMPWFDLTDNSGTTHGLNMNTAVSNTFQVFNPLSNIPFSGRGTQGGTATIRLHRVFLARFIDEEGDEVTGNTGIIIPNDVVWGYLRASISSTTSAPDRNTGSTNRLANMDSSTPIFLDETVVSVTSGTTTTFSLTSLSNALLRPWRTGYAAFSQQGVRYELTSSQTRNIRYNPNTSGNFDISFSDATPTDVTLRASYFDSITHSQAADLSSQTRLTNTDQVYAVSEYINRNESSIPWEVDTTATVSSGTANTGRQANAEAPTSGSWWRLKPGITLMISNTTQASYTESLTRASDGSITGGTVTIPSVALAVGPSGRAIRLDNGRQAGGNVPDGALDVSIIDDYEDVPPGVQPTQLLVQVSSLASGSVWALWEGNNTSITPLMTGSGGDADLTFTDLVGTSDITTGEHNFVLGYSHPRRSTTFKGITTAANTSTTETLVNTLSPTDFTNETGLIPDDVPGNPVTITAAAADDNSRISLLATGTTSSSQRTEEEVALAFAVLRGTQNYLQAVGRRVQGLLTIPLDNVSVASWDLMRFVNARNVDLRGSRYYFPNDPANGSQVLAGCYDSDVDFTARGTEQESFNLAAHQDTDGDRQVFGTRRTAGITPTSPVIAEIAREAQFQSLHFIATDPPPDGDGNP